MIDVALLGTGGTIPFPDRFLASSLIRYNGQLILIDCGEGTQVSIRKLAWGIRNISVVCLTHFHADHTSGLPGFLLTVGQSGRDRHEPLTILGPRGTQRIVDGLRVIAPHLPYPVHILEIDEEMSYPAKTIFQLNDLRISSCHADHEISCLAYRFDLPRLPAFIPEKAKAIGIPVQKWKLLQRGECVEFNGQTIHPEAVLGPPRAGISFGYLTDSRPTKSLERFFTNVDLLISEGTYGDPADQDKAIENKHMTFAEAATLAKNANAKELWLTHFSPALPNPNYFYRQASDIMTNSVIGHEHLSKTLIFPE